MVRKKECELCKSKNLDILGPRIMMILISLLLIIHVLFLIFWKNEANRGQISNLILSCFSLLALISCIRIYFKIPNNFPAEKKGYKMLIFSVLFFFLGDLIWLIDETVRGKLIPIGGFSDISWNLAYLFLITSIYYFKSFSFRDSNKNYYIWLSIALITGLAIGYSHSGLQIIRGTFNISLLVQDIYLIYDLILLVMVIDLILPIVGMRNKIVLSWIILATGIISRSIYDPIFSWMVNNNQYYSGSAIDLIYILFYIAIVLSNIYKCKNIDELVITK